MNMRYEVYAISTGFAFAVCNNRFDAERIAKNMVSCVTGLPLQGQYGVRLAKGTDSSFDNNCQ